MPTKTKFNSGVLAASLLLGSCLFGTSALADPIDIGIASAIRNDVTIKVPDSDSYIPIAVKDAIYLQSEVSSGDNAKMQILLKDETVFTVGSNTDMTIDEFVYDPANENGNKMTASIKRGAFRFMSGRVAKRPNAVQIRTPSASMGVRGTLFEAVIGADAARIAISSGIIPAGTNLDPNQNATLVVLRGPGRGNKGSDRRGEIDVSTDTITVTLDESNLAAFIPEDGRDIFGPFPLSTEALELFDEVLRTAPLRGAPSKKVVAIEAIIEAMEEAAPEEIDERNEEDVDPAQTGEEGRAEERPDTREDEEQGVEVNLPGGPSCNPTADGVCSGN